MPEKKQTLSLKKIRLKNLINSYEKTAQHRLAKCLKPKKQTLSLKNNSGLKNPINSYEKTAQHRLTKWLRPKKTNTLIEKTILVLKTLSFQMKKRHSTVLQNAWSQKNKHSHWKNNSGLKNPINSYEKIGTAPSYKMPEAKKTNTLIEKTILVLKTL